MENKKETYTVGLILGILSLFLGPIFAILCLALSYTNGNNKKYNVKAGVICSIISLCFILIGIILALLIASMTNGYMDTEAKRGCCINYGGVWKDNSCVELIDADFEYTIPEYDYYYKDSRTCK